MEGSVDKPYFIPPPPPPPPEVRRRATTGRSSLSGDTVPFKCLFLLRHSLASEGIAASPTARAQKTFFVGGKIKYDKLEDARSAAKQPANICSIFIFFCFCWRENCFGGGFLFVCFFFSARCFRLSVDLDHRMSVKISRAIPPLHSGGRGAQIVCTSRTSDWKS